MSDSAPDLHMVNLVVDDMAANLDSFRRLGIAVPEDEDPAGGHVQLRMPSSFSLELDTAESARLWHAARRADPAGVSVVVGFSLPTREAVDQRYAELTSVGYAGRQPPFDAFWGEAGELEGLGYPAIWLPGRHSDTLGPAGGGDPGY